MRAQGSLCLHQGVLWVARWAKTVHVRSYDLGGRPLEARFSFRDPERSRSSASGLAVDDERRIWIADAAARRVRAFNLFGTESGGLPRDEEAERRAPPSGSDLAIGDAPGALGEPVALALGTAELLGGAEDGPPLVAVGSAGRRRHAVQLFELESRRWRASLRSDGRAGGHFHGVRRLRAGGRALFVLEHAARRIQVFLGGEFHYAVPIRDEKGAPLGATAFAPLPDGRLVVAWEAPESGLGICDASGTLRRRLAGPAAASAEGGAGAAPPEGGLEGPEDLVVDAAADDRRTRVAVLDRAGVRVQVFSLSGRCYGAFEEPVS